ncbi:YggS family pyridoxal phosphate-dependent enzyme [Rickettsiella massiliensis]|uniref:YggS family pyridoxal phosphate-dependent enzyme n=1 Tax=Rickettsiella massiliensis TaxID=676517 RepID=UPI00029AB916|nr:YggS family pyridoxal phosphate-dependent enzyme [Rickettsiella massiliensis]
MSQLSSKQCYQQFKKNLNEVEQHFGRKPGSVQVIAVSKGQSIQSIEGLAQWGQMLFAENYLQESLLKIISLSDLPLQWHFIGGIQGNKIQKISQYFSWVHSLCDIKTARKFNDAREKSGQGTLQVCLQINLDQESTKSGLEKGSVLHVAQQLRSLSHLHLRGIMVLPKTSVDFDQQRQTFKRACWIFEHLKQAGFEVDTLSMGTSRDFIAAIAEGATHIRVGEALFGPRK